MIEVLVRNDHGRPRNKQAVFVPIVVRTKSPFMLCVIAIQPGFLFNLESLDTLEVREKLVASRR
jgi:hypothetical protein